jgi:hypothetical protein
MTRTITIPFELNVQMDDTEETVHLTPANPIAGLGFKFHLSNPVASLQEMRNAAPCIDIEVVKEAIKQEVQEWSERKLSACMGALDEPTQDNSPQTAEIVDHWSWHGHTIKRVTTSEDGGDSFTYSSGEFTTTGYDPDQCYQELKRLLESSTSEEESLSVIYNTETETFELHLPGGGLGGVIKFPDETRQKLNLTVRSLATDIQLIYDLVKEEDIVDISFKHPTYNAHFILFERDDTVSTTYHLTVDKEEIIVTILTDGFNLHETVTLLANQYVAYLRSL